MFNPGEISSDLPFYPSDMNHWKDFLSSRRNGGRVGNSEVETMKAIWVCPPPCGSCRKHFPETADTRCSQLGAQSRCSSCDEKKWSCDWAQVYFRELARVRLEIADDIFDRLESRWLRESGKQTNPALLTPTSTVRIPQPPAQYDRKPGSDLKPTSATERKGPTILIPHKRNYSAVDPASISPRKRTSRGGSSEKRDTPDSNSTLSHKGSNGRKASPASISAARKPSPNGQTKPLSFSGRPWALKFNGDSAGSVSDTGDSVVDSEPDGNVTSLPRTLARPSRSAVSSAHGTGSPADLVPSTPIPPIDIAEMHKLYASMDKPLHPDDKVAISRGALFELRETLDTQAVYIKQLESKNASLSISLAEARRTNGIQSPKDSPSLVPSTTSSFSGCSLRAVEATPESRTSVEASASLPPSLRSEPVLKEVNMTDPQPQADEQPSNAQTTPVETPAPEVEAGVDSSASS